MHEWLEDLCKWVLYDQYYWRIPEFDSLYDLNRTEIYWYLPALLFYVYCDQLPYIVFWHLLLSLSLFVSWPVILFFLLTFLFMYSCSSYYQSSCGTHVIVINYFDKSFCLLPTKRWWGRFCSRLVPPLGILIRKLFIIIPVLRIKVWLLWRILPTVDIILSKDHWLFHVNITNMFFSKTGAEILIPTLSWPSKSLVSWPNIESSRALTTVSARNFLSSSSRLLMWILYSCVSAANFLTSLLTGGWMLKYHLIRF